jgi:hypothetical protein
MIWPGPRRICTNWSLRITSPAGPELWASSCSCKHPYSVDMVHPSPFASPGPLRPVTLPVNPNRALTQDLCVPSQSGPTNVGSDGLNHSLFRGISGGRTRAACPVGPRKGPPATTGWTPRGRYSRCAAALRSGVVKRNVGSKQIACLC